VTKKREGSYEWQRLISTGEGMRTSCGRAAGTAADSPNDDSQNYRSKHVCPGTVQ